MAPLRCCSFILILSIAVFGFMGTAAAKDGTLSVTIPANPYEIIDHDISHEIQMEGFGVLRVPGKPALPSKIFSVAIPPGKALKEISFSLNGAAALPGSFEINPIPLARVLSNEDPILYANDLRVYEENYKSVYSAQASYPAENAEFIMEGGMRKYNLVDVRFTPFTWNPATKKLIHYESLTVNIRYATPEEPMDQVILEDNLPRRERFAKEVVFNYDQAQLWYPNSSTMNRGLHDYVIITLDTLVTAVQPLVNFETSKGRNVNVVTTTWIASNYTGYDLAQKMRNFLRDKYPASQWGIEDVLLVGHYDSVPMRRVEQDQGYGKPETDFYYAELSLPDSTSWDKDNDHKWLENSDTTDFKAEINVGRIPWSNASTVTSICNKSVAYEQNNDKGFKRNILLLGAFFWANTDNAVLMEYKTNPNNCPWMSEWTSYKMYEKNSGYYSNYPCDEELTNSNVMNHWPKNKYAFVNWAGHGSPTSCHIAGNGAPAFIKGSNCSSLDDSHPAIIFAAACSNSDTDYTNIGQSMLKQGGVGFLGATKVAYGYPGWTGPSGGSCQSLDYYFTSNVTSGNYSLGEAHQAALYKQYTNGGWYYLKYEACEWGAVWGNPNIRLEYHPSITLSLPEPLPQGNQNPGLKNEVKLKIVNGQENYVPGSGMLHYRFDSAAPFTTVALTPIGANVHQAAIPNTKPGDEPEFYFSAQGDGGSTISLPYDAPNNCFSFGVCFEKILWEDDLETNKGWTVDNTNVAKGHLERAVPQATQAQPGSDHSPNGTKCYVTGRLAGSSYGDHDLDGGPARLYTPILDLSQGPCEVSFYVYFYHSTNGGQIPLKIHQSKDSGNNWVLKQNITHNPQWAKVTYNVKNPTATMQYRFTASDEPNDSVVEFLLDDFSVKMFNYNPSLWADAYGVPVSSAFSVQYSMDAGAAYAGRTYLVLGGLSGTSPGFDISPGVHVPLNWDAFTNLILTSIGTPFFKDFAGNLDGNGCATASFNSFTPLPSSMVGLDMDFVFVLAPPLGWDFASNNITITFNP